MKEKLDPNPIGIKFKPSTKKALEMMAEEKDRSVSYLVREIVEEYFNKIENIMILKKAN